jgi:hypothetical protein
VYQFKKIFGHITNKLVTHDNLMKFIHDKGNAKLGDSLVNFIYSIAKTIVSERPTGTKVSDSILSEAYRGSMWNKSQALKLTGDKGKIADFVEALVLFFWINQSLSLEDLISPIVSELEPNKLHHPREEQSSAANSFQKLLDELFQIYKERI